MIRRDVPWRTKILYGIGDVGLALKNSAINQFLLFFYADVLLASPTYIGAAIFAGKLWDAVTDPVMGYISDTTRSRWGRRRPYVVASAIPMGVCFYLMFAPPELSSTGNVLYLAAAGIALYTFFTVFATPYLAWGAELATDYHERTEVVQIRALFGVLGGVAGAVAPVIIVRQFDDPRAGYAMMGLVLGAMIAASGLATGLAVADRPVHSAPSAGFGHFLAGVRSTFHNRQFAIVFATFCLMTVSASLGQAVQLIVIKYHLGMYDAFPGIALTFALAYAASFPIWQSLSVRLGKSRALLAGLATSCVSPFGWLLVQPGNLPSMLVFMVIIGGLSGSITLAASQAADIVEADEQRTGEQRAGAYFGVWTLGLKTAGALGTLLGGVLLSTVGYLPDQEQPAGVTWWLVLALGPLQAIVHLGGYLVFRRLV